MRNNKIIKGITTKVAQARAQARAELEPRKAAPDELLGELFQDVQFKRIYRDGMTFVDMVPANKLREILKSYAKHRHDPYFDLHEFVQHHFKDYIATATDYRTNPSHTVEQHIHELWNVLTRSVYKNIGSLIALPHPYVVAGGRFSAQFYWDSYFVMLGLAADDRWDMVENMVKNFAFMIRKFGHIPNGNRTYFVGRSQPPLFASMVRLLAEHRGKRTLVQYLPYMLAEHHFWMKGHRSLSDQRQAYRRVVRMPNGQVLNRYYDDKTTPRPESYKEDIDTALAATARMPSKVYLDLRAAAESGWDFSSRWCKDAMSLPSIQTTDIVPVDLNAYLIVLEQTIADAYRVLKQGRLAKKFAGQAEERKTALDNYCWNSVEGFYFDYNFALRSQTGCLTNAGFVPMWVGTTTQEQATRIADNIEKKLLKPGGLVITIETTGQQWDAPNGWAPFQWMAIVGLRTYGFDDLASDIKKRWIQTCVQNYAATGKLVEKYNVVDPTMPAGGGEYTLQDGFGWTNGVLLALLHDKDVTGYAEQK